MLKFTIQMTMALSFGFLVSACSHAKKDYSYMNEAAYQSRPALQQSLVDASGNLSEPAIQKILSSKVTMPKKITLAVVRLSDSNSGLDFQIVNDEAASKFFDKANWGERVQSVIPVPQMMMAKPQTLTNLRQVAALLQADVLLILKPYSYGDWDFKLFKPDTGKAITSLEVLLLDTRSGVVPYTSLISETAEVPKGDRDYSTYELTARAKKESETKALLQVAPALKQFFSKTL